MLQQTQVERVVPRYLAWLERWPTAAALAAAPVADVIREWQGLGYNRRAVNLHRAGRQIAESGWPDDLTELPGVGRYTADAVAAFAFGAPVLPEDTNVRRVQERTGHRFEPACAQALMDLGATVCLARIPRCGVCPLASACSSRGRRYEPLRRQGPFEGSFRQRRARVLRAVAERPRTAAELDGDAVAALERDGLVRVEDGRVGCRPERYSGAVPRIENYRFGRIVVDGSEETADVIVLPARIVRNWRRRNGHSLVLEDLDEVLEELPHRLVIGTGANGRLHPDPVTLELLRQRGIDVESLPTDEAVRRFQELDPAATAAALHLTC